MSPDALNAASAGRSSMKQLGQTLSAPTSVPQDGQTAPWVWGLVWKTSAMMSAELRMSDTDSFSSLPSTAGPCGAAALAAAALSGVISLKKSSSSPMDGAASAAAGDPMMAASASSMGGLAAAAGAVAGAAGAAGVGPRMPSRSRSSPSDLAIPAGWSLPLNSPVAPRSRSPCWGMRLVPVVER